MVKAGSKLKDVPLYPISPKEGKKIIIYGTGDVAERYYKEICKTYGNQSILFFLEGQSVLSEFCNKPVINVEKLKSFSMNDYNYVLASFSNAFSMHRKLSELGVKEENIFRPMNCFNMESLYKADIKIHRVAIYPPIFTQKEKEKIIHMIHYFIPANSKINGCFEILSKEENQICHFLKVIDITKEGFKSNDYDVILVQEPEQINNPEIIEHPHIYCIHPDIIQHLEAKILTCISMKMLVSEEKKKYEFNSISNFNRLKKQHNKAYVFGSGPSVSDFIQRYKPEELQDGIRIVCNEFCESDTLISWINPDIYVIWDYGYFGKRLEHTLNKIIKVIKTTKCILVIPDIALNLLQKKFQLENNKLIGISSFAKTITFPTSENLETFRTPNVLTALSVPLASGLCKTIYIIGCDGMKDDGVWEHSRELKGESINYCNEEVKKLGKQLTFAKVKGIEDYYVKLFKYGEQHGKQYISLTKSYIPALENRYQEEQQI